MEKEKFELKECEELIYFIGLYGINMGLPAMMAEGERERETSFEGPKEY